MMNTKKTKYKIAVVLIICMLFTLTSCDKGNKKENVTTEAARENVINVYYPEGDTLVQDDEGYQVKQPDTLTAAVEEVMTVMSAKLGTEIIQYHTYMIDGENNVTLDFLLVGEYDKEYFLLARAAVTKTLFQLDDINNINITLTDNSGEVVLEESYDRNSFFYY